MFLNEMGGVASFVNDPVSKTANFDLCKVNALRVYCHVLYTVLAILNRRELARLNQCK